VIDTVAAAWAELCRRFPSAKMETSPALSESRQLLADGRMHRVLWLYTGPIASRVCYTADVDESESWDELFAKVDRGEHTGKGTKGGGRNDA